MDIKRVTASAILPITLQEAKDHLRVDSADDDSLIEALIAVAVDRVDGRTGTLGRALITQTWDLVCDLFPWWEIPVPLPPLQSVTSIQYIATDGTLTTLSSSLYKVDTVSEPGRITPAYAQVWPATRDEINAVTVRFVAGYGATAQSVPTPIRQALLLTIGHWYLNRETTTDARLAEMPLAAQALLAPLQAGLRNWPDRAALNG